MELHWHRAATILTKINPSLTTRFDFDIVEESLNIVCNGLNKHTFPKTGVWKSPTIRWVRAGLVVWDFLLQSTRIQLEKAQIVVLVREEEDWRIELTCRVEEVHMQSRAELGDLIYGEVQSYSKLCGRAVLAIEKINVLRTEDEL